LYYVKSTKEENLSRLFINLFFIIILCFTLAVLPINTAALEMLDFGNMFNQTPEEAEVEEVPVDETFIAEYNLVSETPNVDRIYNPDTIKLSLETNIPKAYESNYDFEDITLTLYQNDELFQILSSDKILISPTIRYENDLIHVDYEVQVDYYSLGLNRDGFFNAEISFAVEKNLPSIVYPIAYRPEIKYVDNGTAQNNGNFIYKAFFKNEAGTHLVPTYFSVPYPESITVEVRNRLYNPPPLGYGLSSENVIPDKSSISKLGDKYYGVFMYSDEISKVIDNTEQAQLAIDALVQSLIRLPHIDRLTFFVDDAQVADSLYDIDLTTIYEARNSSYVYLSERNSTSNRYLIPLEVSGDNVYDIITLMFETLKTGYIDDKQWVQMIPPEVMMNAFTIEGTTVTADFNGIFLTAYQDDLAYQRMMINSILYSFTSHPNINKVIITVDGEVVTNYGGYNFTEAQLEPSYINFIGEY